MTAITDLEIFARVSRTGNMSAAGREMGLSPAVVSKRISLLEDRLGARLFQRTTRQLTLTETGDGYFKRVVDILSLIDEAEDFVSRRNTKPRGQLKVTAPTTFSRLHIAPYLSEFLKQYPEIDLNFHLTDNFSDIIGEGFDLAIRIGELQDSSLVAKKLAKDTRVICAAPSYIEENGAPTNLTQLAQHNCLSAGAQNQWRLTTPDGPQQLKLTGNIRSNSSELTRQTLLAGLGIGLRPTWDIGPDLASGALQIIMPEYRGSENIAIYAVYPCRDFMPAKVSAFIDFLAELYGNQRYWENDYRLSSSVNSQTSKAAAKRVERKPAAANKDKQVAPN